MVHWNGNIEQPYNNYLRQIHGIYKWSKGLYATYWLMLVPISWSQGSIREHLHEHVALFPHGESMGNWILLIPCTFGIHSVKNHCWETVERGVNCSGKRLYCCSLVWQSHPPASNSLVIYQYNNVDRKDHWTVCTCVNHRLIPGHFTPLIWPGSKASYTALVKDSFLHTYTEFIFCP